jgi:hypothetical protein
MYYIRTTAVEVIVILLVWEIMRTLSDLLLLWVLRVHLYWK